MLPPTTNKSQRRLLCAMLLLALATHLLSAQLAHAAAPDEPIVITLRERAERIGGRLTLGNVCEVDGLPAALRDRQITPRNGEAVTVLDIVRALSDAGVRQDLLHIRGATECAVTDKALPAPPVVEVAAADPAGEWDAIEAVATPRPKFIAPDLRLPLIDRLKADLAGRLSLSVEQITLEVSARDAELAADADATLVRPERADDLGRVSWRVRDAEGRDRLLRADAHATAARLVLARPVGRGQTIEPGDVRKEMATLTSINDVALALDQVAGQQAARDLAIGQTLTADLLAPRLLVRRGQPLTVLIDRRGVQLQTIAYSRDDASLGQIVRAACEATGRTLVVRVTGPQVGLLSR